jgi:hypothetical protein
MLLRVLVVLAAFVALYLPGASEAQEPPLGRINGHVIDPMGAAVPDAKVFIHKSSPSDDNVRLVAHTDSTGYFTISLPEGGYDVLVTAPGFAAAVNTLSVIGGRSAKVDWKLKVLDCNFPDMNCDTFP